MKASSLKFAKRFIAFTVAAIMVLAMSVTAFADPPDNVLDSTGAGGAGNVLYIPKGITLLYDAGVKINFYLPDLSCSFTIVPATPPAGTMCGAIAVVKGPDGSASISGPTFSSSEMVNGSSGIETKKYITVTIDPTKFDKPGIYRYVITDATSTAALYAAGIVRTGHSGADYLPTRYLDVYVAAKSDATGYEVTGYVLHSTNDVTYTAEGKSIGFVYDDHHGNDTYRNLATMLKKVVKGTMGDRTHAFPFTVTVNNLNKPFHYSVYTIPDGQDRGDRRPDNDTSITWNYVDDIHTFPATISLKHNEALVIRGLCPQATVNYTETNNTSETYKVRADYLKDNTDLNEQDSVFQTERDVAAGGTLALSETPLNISNYATVNSDSDVTTVPTRSDYRYVQYTNKINAVSPTGIILRFAPFVVLAGFAGLLLVLAGKTKKKETKVRKI